MAKVTIVGDAIVVTSSLKLEDIQTIQKYRPKALTLMGEGENPEPLFCVGYTAGRGNINEYGASFNRASHDDAKLATITITIKSADEDIDIKEAVADSLGGALISLGKLEETLPAVLEEIKAQKAAVMENITVA